MKIRQAKPEHKDEWLRMRLALWPDSLIESRLAEIQEYFSEGGGIEAFVAERPQGGLGGFIEVSTRSYAEGCDTSPVGYIEGWYVDSDLRLQGIGAQLVRTAESWVTERGLKEIASDCLIDNETSMKAHLALGYQETERLIHFKKRLSS